MNSLSNLIGSYMSEYSESEPEDENNDESKSKQKSFSTEIGNLLNEISDNKNSVLESASASTDPNVVNYKALPVTDWTQCLDLSTGHPYYWNITTKEVTWDKPIEYIEYLNKIEKLLTKIPDDCWIIGYSDSKVPYYVNEYTRVVSWEKPENYKSKNVIGKKKKGKKLKNSSVAFKKLKEKQENKICVKKKLPKHLSEDNDIDVKIELIQSYTTKSSDSSGSENELKEKVSSRLDQPKRNLVAAYSTEEEDSENDLNDKSTQPIIPPQKTPCSKDKSIRKILSRDSSVEDGNETNSTLSAEKTKTQREAIRSNTFASIITGDKPEDQFNDEINKLKEELEKELLTTANKSSDSQNEDEKQPTNENEPFAEKNFKRKRRIEFGTNRSAIPAASTSKSSPDDHDESSVNSLIENNGNKNDNNSAIQLLKKKNMYTNFERSHVEFTNDKLGNNTVESSSEKKVAENKIKSEINELSDLLLDKVKFLNIGHNISPVQVIQIQLETLIAAYNSSALDKEYFLKWLKEIEADLVKLEKNAAPEGWICKWNRKESKYFYENSKTSEIQWEYPNVEKSNHQNEKVNVPNEKLDERGEMEMEISTTPPPNENEQIIVKQHLSADGCWDADNAPPPPIISMPSPQQANIYSINNELASFYSDIATLDTPQQTNLEINNSTENEKRPNDDTTVNVIKKKRKKMKVQGLSTMNTKNEVFSMVAKWEKVQKELNQ